MRPRNINGDAIAAVAFAAAWADGAICNPEMQALNRVLAHLGYQPDEILARIGKALEGPQLVLSKPPEDLAIRLEMMRYALVVTLADGSLAKNEVNFLVQLAGHLGISWQALAIMKKEAEGLVGDEAEPALSSIVSRVEMLLPDTKLAEPQAVAGEPAGRTTLSELLEP